jgi:hypothetical protein
MNQKITVFRQTYTKLQLLTFLLILVMALALIIYLITSGQTTSSSGNPVNSSAISGTRPSASDKAILAPAKVPPVVAECSQTLSYSSDGVPGPLTCSDNDLNRQAWNALAAQEPSVMSLGYSPSLSSVQSAICSDANASAADSKPGADNALETADYQISALYYGWNFGSSPTNILSSSNC